MNKKVLTKYIVVGTYFTLDGNISHAQSIGGMFSALSTAQKWVISNKGGGLLEKCSEYALSHGMTVELSQNDAEGLSYLLEVVDGKTRYPSIQYDIVALKYKMEGVQKL